MSLVEPALAERVLARALARGGDFAELYAEARHGFGVSIDDRRVERPQGGRERGACVRVVHGDSSYYGHVDGLAEEDLLRVAASVAEGLRGEASEPAALSAADPPEARALESFHQDLITHHLERDLRSHRVLREVARETR